MVGRVAFFAKFFRTQRLRYATDATAMLGRRMIEHNTKQIHTTYMIRGDVDLQASIDQAHLPLVLAVRSFQSGRPEMPTCMCECVLGRSRGDDAHVVSA